MRIYTDEQMNAYLKRERKKLRKMLQGYARFRLTGRITCSKELYNIIRGAMWENVNRQGTRVKNIYM